MAEEFVKFQGSIPEFYNRYLVPLIFNPFARDMALRIDAPAGGQVLELAAGTGAVSRVLRDWLAPDVKLTVTDLNEPMLEVSKTKFEAHENVEFNVVDALEIPYGDNSFDVIACQFGVMFFPDREVGYKEIARVLKPGGTFIFNFWDSVERNELSNSVKKTLFKRFPDTQPKFFDTPFGHYNVEEHRQALDAAGFGDLSISVIEKKSVGANARHVAEGYLLGSPLTQEILELNEASVDDVIDDVTKDLASNFGESPVIGKMRAVVFEARLS